MKVLYYGHNSHLQCLDCSLHTNDKTFIELDDEVSTAACSWSNMVLVSNSGSSAEIQGIVGNELLNKSTKLPSMELFKKVCSCSSKAFAITEEGTSWQLSHGTWNRLVYKEESNSQEILQQQFTQFTVEKDTEGDACSYDIACNDKACLVVTKTGKLFYVPHDGPLSTPISMQMRGQRIEQVACGKEHYIARTFSGSVFTWGSGTRGQIGIGSLESHDQPQEVLALAGICITSVAAGGWHSLVLSEEGDVYAWGWNRDGQLGRSCPPVTQEEQDENLNEEGVAVMSLPEPVDLASRVLEISCGARHSMVLMNDGTLMGCGWAEYGQLGSTQKKRLCCMTKISTKPGVKVQQIFCGGWSTLVLVT